MAELHTHLDVHEIPPGCTCRWTHSTACIPPWQLADPRASCDEHRHLVGHYPNVTDRTRYRDPDDVDWAEELAVPNTNTRHRVTRRGSDRVLAPTPDWTDVVIIAAHDNPTSTIFQVIRNHTLAHVDIPHETLNAHTGPEWEPFCRSIAANLNAYLAQRDDVVLAVGNGPGIFPVTWREVNAAYTRMTSTPTVIIAVGPDDMEDGVVSYPPPSTIPNPRDVREPRYHLTRLGDCAHYTPVNDRETPHTRFVNTILNRPRTDDTTGTT